jgi:hypothetical protein
MADSLSRGKNWYIVLDAEGDARLRGLCACPSCVRQYIAAFEAAADDVMDVLMAEGLFPRGSSITVLRGRYGEPPDEDPADDLESARPGTSLAIQRKAAADWDHIATSCHCPYCT